MSIGDVTLSKDDAEAAMAALTSKYTPTELGGAGTPTAVVTVVLSQKLSVSMDIGTGSNAS